MLITFIVTVAILAVLYLVMIICNKIIVRPDYDFATGTLKPLLVFVHIVFLVCLAVIASGIGFYYSGTNRTTLWSVYGIFLFFAVLFLLMIYVLYFTYEAIKDDVVYVHRFFKIKKIKVSDIKHIGRGSAIIDFCDKRDKCLFLADAITPGINELIRLINERKALDPNAEAREQAVAEEKAVLAKLGREYRASYKQRKKKFKITYSVGSILFLAAIVVPFAFMSVDTIMLVCLGIMGALAVIVIFFGELSIMKKELKYSDELLGKRHKFDNKRVKGASKHLLIKMSILCVTFMILGAMLTLPLLSIYAEEKNYDEFTRVTGTLEYSRENTIKYHYIAIGFYDMPTEYRLSYANEFDYSFFDEVKVGDAVTILVGNGDDREISLRRYGKDRWNDFYYLEAGGKEYFTREDYIKSRENNDKDAWIVVVGGIASFVAATVTLIGAYIVYKKREKQEDIEIYKD